MPKLNQERTAVMGGRKKGRENVRRALDREKVTMTNAFNLGKYEASDGIAIR